MSDVALEGFGGGGGTSLNFNVKDYATEELLMAATGKVNEIGIITSTPMTGWHFAAEQPEMLPGEVWISTGTSSEVAFNALKKGGTVMVYPLSAKQMQGGTLVDVTARSWQDGEWVDWIKRMYICKAGNMLVEPTYNPSSTYITGAKQGNGFVVDTKQGSNYAPFMLWENINLSDYKTLYVEMSNVNVTGTEKIIAVGTAAITNPGYFNPANYGTAKVTFDNASDNQIVSLDVYGLSNNHNLIFAIGGTSTATIHNILLEG